jgi:hypothetical protein
MPFQNRGSHLCVLVVIVLDEICIAHAGFLFDEDCCFDDFSETCCVGIAGWIERLANVAFDLEQLVGYTDLRGP